MDLYLFRVSPSKEATRNRILSRHNNGKPWHSEATKELMRGPRQPRGPDTEETKKNKKTAANRPDVIAKNRASTIKQFQDPKQREKQRAATIKQWQDPEFVAKQMVARNVCPNKAEIFLDKLLQKIYPNEYKYVGDGEFILSGKCPDFVNVNGQKKIIELFGEYWHEPEEEQQRIDLFAQFGYETLVIWYKELDDIEAVEKKLSEFTI